MTAIRRDTWLAFLLCASVGSLVFLDTLGYPEVRGQGFGQGPAFYPQVLAASLLFLGILLVFLDLGSRGRTHSTERKDSSGAAATGYTPVALLMVLCVLTILSMKYLGFFVSGFLLTVLSAFIIRRPSRIRQLGLDLLFSAGIILLVYLVFELFVGIELPSSIFLD
jgi:uncharacterized membrane protein YecN with MAPEG domain